MANRSRTKAKPARAFDRDAAIALAQTITGSRKQFEEVFRRAQSGRREALEFEVVAEKLTDKTAAFAEGFLRADQGGWLAQLCIDCLAGHIVGDGFAAAAAAATDDVRLAKLQQLVNKHRGTRSAGLLVDRLPRAVRQVCQIEIYKDGIGWEPHGTGFLIRSDLVMTAYHVVAPLLEADDTESEGSARKLRVRFDFSLREGPNGEVTLLEGLVCRVADPWLEKTSACTADERLDMLPQDENNLDGFWDFAVIRLAEAPGVPRAGLEVSDAPVAPGHQLMILQHPNQRPVGWNSGSVKGFLGAGGFRIVHAVNTEPGSSGSPCLNDNFKVVGLHQAAMPDDPKKKRKRNRAVPMRRILDAWKLTDARPLGAVFSRLLAVDTKQVPQHPLFGRTKLQEWIGRAAAGATGRERFLVVAGPKGSGKSLSIDVLRAMLPAGEHSILEEKASDFNSKTTAMEFASKYLLAPLGADASRLPGLNQADTSDNAWLSYQLIGDLLNVMDQSRNNRMVWVVLDELDEVGLPDQGQVRKLLDLLYQRAERTPWLRFVLLGLEAVPVPETAAFTERDFLSPESEATLAADIGDYLLRLLETKGVFVGETFVRATVSRIVKLCVDACKQDPRYPDNQYLRHPELMAKVAKETMDFERDLGLRPRE